MMTRCSICKLPHDRLAAIDGALRHGGVSLHEIANRSGLSKSSLHRHVKHVNGVPRGAAEPTLAETRAVVPAPVPELPAKALPPASKAQLLQRVEFLWTETLEGLAAAKAPIHVNKPDGSIVELPGDLGVRRAFISEARAVLELQGAANGTLVRGEGPTLQVQLVIGAPGQAPATADDFGGATIDIRRIE